MAAAYGNVDDGLLAQLRLLNSARVAVWCWAGATAGVAELRPHGEHHLAVLRGADLTG